MNADYEPVITLAVRGPSGRWRDTEAVVDTGFNGFLTLPTQLVTDLELPFASIGRATLADGSEVAFSVFRATVHWDGRRIDVEASGADTTPLVGMRLLDGYNLNIDVTAGGRVLIQASV